MTKILNENLQTLDVIQNLASLTSKMTSWPQRPQKRLSIFFKKYVFKISGSSWEKWAIARFSSKTFKCSNLCYFLVASKDKELKNGICKGLNRKLSYSSFFSAWCTDLKNIIFEKIHSASSEVVEVKRSFSRSLRPNFGFHLIFIGFHLKIFVILSFEVVWPRRPQRPRKPQGRRFSFMAIFNL